MLYANVNEHMLGAETGGLLTSRAVIYELRSKAAEVYPSYEQGGKGPSGSGHDVLDECDEVVQRESSGGGWCGRRGGQAIVGGLDKADDEGGHSF